jgi:hypothetical protein
MLESTDIMIGRIAVASGLINDEKLDELVSLLKSSEAGKTVEDLLLDRGEVTAPQAEDLRRLREDIRAGRGVENKQFGEAAVEHGFVTPAQLARARTRQVEMETRGEVRSLGEVMVDLGLIAPHQIQRILERQKRVELVCAVCGKSYKVLVGSEQRARCPTCAVRLAPAEEARKVISPAEATAILEATALTPAGAPAAASKPVPRATELRGKMIAGCEIQDLLGKGSMAEVYRAKHLALGRVVAIKILPATGKGQLMVRRLLFEARAIAKLNHDNIVTVYDAGLAEGHLFLVMQYVEGQTLDAYVNEQGQLLEERAVAITRDVLRGLKAAHATGIVHRDLKPANIMIDAAGKARIMDFGLALDVAKADEISGMIVGTPYYMSPEQWLGRKADERSDLYALGFIFYVMLTAHKPFDSTAVSELMEMHLKKAPIAPTKYRPTLNKRLTAILRKAMSKHPANRYQSADDFLSELARVDRGEDPEAMGQFGKTVKCGFCEALNPEGKGICKVCGEPLQTKGQALTLAARGDEFRCPACKEFVKRGSRICPHCQRPFCRRCLKRLAVAGGHCRVCVPPQTQPQR